jgi:WD40 repeat protein
VRRRIVLLISLAVAALLAGGVRYWQSKSAAFDDEDAGRPAGGRQGSGGRQARGLTATGARSLSPARFFEGHLDGVHAVEFSPDGKLLLTGSHDGSARLWDVSGGKELRSFVAHGGAVLDAGFSADGKRIVTAGDDGKVMVWDAANGDLLSILPGHPGGYANAAAFLPDGTVVSAGSDGMVRRWDVDDEAQVGQLHGHRTTIYAMDVSRDGKRAATGSADGMLVLWDLEAGRSLWQSPWPPGPGGPPAVRCVAISPDGSTVFASAYGRSPEGWDARSGRNTRSFGPGGVSATLAVSGDGKQLLIAATDGTNVWDLDTMRTTAIFVVPDQRVVHAAAFSPDAHWAVLGRGGYHSPGIGWTRADDPRVPVWDLSAKQ